MTSARLALALCALVTLLPANAALAQEPMPAESESAETAAPPPGEEAAQSPAPASESAASADPGPAAKPAQADFGAPNEYTEEGVPEGTGEDTPPEEPVDDGGDGDTQPAAPQPQPSAGAAPTAEVTADVGSAGDLPRTGLDGWALALAGVLLLLLGLLLRRIAAADRLA